MDIDDKIAKYNKLKNRVLCGFCNQYVYCRRVCKTEQKAETCKKLHPPPPPPPPKTTCPYCGKKFKKHQALGGHMVCCPLNPKSKARNKKVSESRKGFHHSEETKKKISVSVSLSIKLKIESKSKSVRTVTTGHKDKPIKLKFF